MNFAHRQKGFSLTEVLLAVGTLAIGMSFVGGTFLVGVHLSTVATERTVAASVADEAFAKIQLYGINTSTTGTVPQDQQYLYANSTSMPVEEFAYPSTKIKADKQYYWSALYRPLESSVMDNTTQVTVFISRKVGSGSAIPVPVQVAVTAVAGAGNENKLTITTAGQESYINAGSTIVANKTGKIYRVLQRDSVTQNTITLDQPWQEGLNDSVWVIQPAASGRNSCIATYQKEIRF